MSSVRYRPIVDSIKQNGVDLDSSLAVRHFRRTLLLEYIHEGAYESVSKNKCQRDLSFREEVLPAILSAATQ